MSQVDDFRLTVLRHISGLSSFSASWPSFARSINRILGPSPTSHAIYSLGSELETIFKSNVVTGRSNSAVSQGGAAWECLNCWYLNLVLWGTDAVVVKPLRKFTPTIISDALSVSISNYTTNTESDLIAFSVPRVPSIESLTLDDIDLALQINSRQSDVTVIQCKTNWNDNAQIPMLWDLIYSTQTFRVPNVSVGINGVSPTSFRKFAYSFITVPTSRGPFNSSSMAVLRVKNLSGGNYWGRASQTGVARSISEFFTANYSQSFPGTVKQSIQNNVLNSPQILHKFLTLNF